MSVARTPAAPIDPSRPRADEQSEARNYLRCPLLSGRLITEITFPALTATTISHGLGRTPRGYLIVDDAATMTSLPTSLRRSSWDSMTMTLYSDTNCLVSLWVF